LDQEKRELRMVEMLVVVEMNGKGATRDTFTMVAFVL
jgi:hypothetical protein